MAFPAAGATECDPLQQLGSRLNRVSVCHAVFVLLSCRVMPRLADESRQRIARWMRLGLDSAREQLTEMLQTHCGGPCVPVCFLLLPMSSEIVCLLLRRSSRKLSMSGNGKWNRCEATLSFGSGSAGAQSHEGGVLRACAQLGGCLLLPYSCCGLRAWSTSRRL